VDQARRIAGVVALGLVLFAMWFDWNMLRGPIERRVTQVTGREFHIDGDLDVDLSFRPGSRSAHALRQRSGAKDPYMASVDRLQFRLHLMRLLRGR
jgi:uncharacterized protein involved in outer membrane biogenesis